MTNCQPGKKIYVEVDAPRKVKADTPHKVKADAPHKVKADTPHEVKADAPGEVKADASREVNTDDSQDFDRARNHFGADIYGNDAWKICMDGQPGVFRAIYINARFDEDCVVRNAHIVTAKDGPGKWKKEERDGKMPIKSEETFILCVTFQTNSFEIAFNGWHFATYRYQTQLTPGPITTMLLSMIPYVRRIKYV